MAVVNNAVVTDVRYRMALAPIRCMSQMGWWVTGVEFESVPKREALGFYSNRIDIKRRIPDDRPVEAFYELCKNMDIPPAVIPVSRRWMDILMDNPQLSEVCRWSLPTREVLELVDDKKRITERAQALDIPTPETWQDMSKVRFPAIVKYRNGELLGIKAEDRYFIVNNPEELEAALETVYPLDPDPVVQEYIPGHDCGIAAVMHNGMLVDYIAYESLMEYPLDGGPTCLLRAVEGGKMLMYARKLLKDIGYTGLAMLDFRGPAEDPRFLEINPRVWGCASICDLAGSRLFDSWGKSALGEMPMHLGYEYGRPMKLKPQYYAALFANAKRGHALQSVADLYKYRRVADGLRYLDMGPYHHYLINLCIDKLKGGKKNGEN